MSEQVIPEAFFDSLSIAHKLDNYLDGFRQEEIHLFSYFSSLLFGYRGNNISDWGYKYIPANNGYPFSNEINESVRRHIRNGLFEAKGDYFIISGRGVDEYNKFKTFTTFTEREEFLNAACTTNILVPYSQTVRALLNEPEIQKSIEIDNKSWLDQSSIYAKISEISEAVGISKGNLIVPAVTWINYLNEKENAVTK